MTTWSPQSTCGVKLGLCLPRRMLATIVASRPTTSPSASIRCHFFSTSAGLTDLVVFISAFMARYPLFRMSSAAPCRAARTAGKWQSRGETSRNQGGFARGTILPLHLVGHPSRIVRERRGDRPHHRGGHVVAVQLADPLDQPLRGVGAGLEDRRHLGGFLDSALPAVDGKTGGEDVGAGGEPLLDQPA